MTAEEKMRRKLAVENMHRIYKKYYPMWVEQHSQDANTSGEHREAEKSASFLFFHFHFFGPCDIMLINT